MKLALTNSELVRLEEAEQIIKSGLASFMEVGEALMAIRDGKLYREKFKTFEEYCRKRWDMGRRHAYRLIDAKQVYDMCPIGHKPQTESQARPLTKLPPEQQADGWKRAQQIASEAGVQVKAKHVEMAVAEIDDETVFVPGDPGPKSNEDFNRADEDTNCLFHLKSRWKKATKKDKVAFLNWLVTKDTALIQKWIKTHAKTGHNNED